MARIPQYTRDAMDIARAHLDVDDHAFKGDDTIRNALSDPRVKQYLSSWVFPQLTLARDGLTPDTRWMPDANSRNAAEVRRDRTEATARQHSTGLPPPPPAPNRRVDTVRHKPRLRIVRGE